LYFRTHVLAPKDSHQCTACIRTTTLCRARKHVECRRQRRAPRAHAARAHRARAQLQHLRPQARGRRRAGACPRLTGSLPRLCPSVGWRYFARVPLVSRRASVADLSHPRFLPRRRRTSTPRRCTTSARCVPPEPPPPRFSTRTRGRFRNRLARRALVFDTARHPKTHPRPSLLSRDPADQGPHRGVRRRVRRRRADRGLHPRVRHPVPAAQGFRVIARRGDDDSPLRARAEAVKRVVTANAREKTSLASARSSVAAFVSCGCFVVSRFVFRVSA